MSAHRRKLPLQVVLTVSFVLVAASAIAVLGAQLYLWVTRSLLEEELEQDQALARAVAVAVDRHVVGTRYLVDAVAKELQTVRLDDRVALQAVVESVMRRHLSFATLGITDRHGITVVTSPSQDSDGRPAAGRGYADRPWFTDLLRTGHQHSYDVLVGKVTREPAVVVSAPIRTPAGDLAGVVWGGLALDQLRSLIRTINPGIKDRLVMVDAAGRVIAHFSREWEAEAHDLSDEEVFLASRQSAEGAVTHRSSVTGQQSWGSYVRVPSTGWVVWTNRGPALLTAKVHTLLSELLVAGIGTVLLSAIAAIFLSRALSRPLRALAVASRGVSDRRFHVDAVAPYRGSRIAEFSQLVTRFCEMAESIDAQYEGLEAKVTERTQALAQQTREAQAAVTALRVQEQIQRGYGELMEHLNAALKRASDVKSEFLASMSHELRTPLNSIIGFTELLLTGRDQLAPRHRSALEKVLASGRHLLDLINDILDLSKIEAGRMEVRAETVHVRALADECLSVLEPQARAKGLPIELVEVSPELTLQQDRGKVKQILLNLLSNAVKFTSQGRVELRADAEGDAVAIAVTDTGPGLAPEEQERMFEPFQQGDASSTRAAGGTGLGLAISRRLAHIMGGSLTLVSDVGRGSVFTLRLPRHHIAPPVTAPLAQKEPRTATVDSRSDGVLVIDDDRNVFEIIRQAVAEEPFTVGWASAAATGLARARSSHPSAIMLDVMLQGRDDGWDVLHALKSDPQTRHIPVVIHSVIDNPHRARELGADEVLVKPAPTAEIKALLRSYLGAHGASHPEAIDHET